MECNNRDENLEENLTPDCEAMPEETVVEEAIVEEIEVEETVVEEIEVEETVCEQTPEEPVKKEKKDTWKVIVLSVALAVVTCLLAVVLLKDQGVDLVDWAGDLFAPQGAFDLRQDVYTADEEDPAKLVKDGDKVVGKLGDTTLTNADLQVYYWSGVGTFVNNYQYYLTSYGLDISLPLYEQDCLLSDGSWEKFFLENAITTWQKYAALAQQAKQENYELSDAQRTAIESHYMELEQLRMTGGYESVEEMIQTEFGPMCTEEAYRQYVETYFLASDYFSMKYESFAPTDAEMEEFFLANESAMTEQGITRDSLSYNVRHILIEPKDGVTDESGNVTYTDAQWEACRVEAKAMMDQWKAEDGTEEGFAQLAMNYSTDGGSSSEGGLYSGLTSQTSFVEEFKEWYLDPSRQVGDVGLVKTVYGYHIMYFSGTESLWYSECYNGVLQQKSENFVQNCMDAFEMKIFDKKIAIGNVALAQ